MKRLLIFVYALCLLAGHAATPGDKIGVLSGNNPVIDWSTEQIKTWTLGGTSTPSFANTPATATTARKIQVQVIQPAAQNYTVTGPSSVVWIGTSWAALPSNSTNTIVFQWNGAAVLGWWVESPSTNSTSFFSKSGDTIFLTTNTDILSITNFTFNGTVISNIVQSLSGASDTWTNDAGNVHVTADYDQVSVTNLTVFSTLIAPSKVIQLTLGTNILDCTTNSFWDLSSPTNDASQVILSLTPPKFQGQWIIISSQNSSGAFTLPHGSEQAGAPGAFVWLGGSDWLATTNRGIMLRNNGPDWVAMDRWFPAGGGGGITINQTDGYQPVRTNATTLVDSDWFRFAPSFIAHMSNGIPQLVIDSSGAITSGSHTSNYFGGLAIVGELLSFNDTTAGDPNGYSITFGAGNPVVGTSHSFFIAEGADYYSAITASHTSGAGGANSVILLSQDGLAQVQAQVEGVVKMTLSPAADESGPSYVFDSSFYRTNTSISEFSVRNFTTNIFQVLPNGATIQSGITKAAKTAMTPQNGTIIYQTDNTPGFRAYINGTWVLLSTSADP